jgi:hypothetical protein
MWPPSSGSAVTRCCWACGTSTPTNCTVIVTRRGEGFEAVGALGASVSRAGAAIPVTRRFCRFTTSAPRGSMPSGTRRWSASTPTSASTAAP